MMEEQLRRRLGPELSHSRLGTEGYRQAAVLVPLEPGRGVWLTRRSSLLPNHAGQVSFPGGKIEAQDASAAAAALREAEEEVGLKPADAELLGRMDDYVTGTGFHITPVIALVARNIVLRPAPDEVQEIFCLPFETLLDPALPRRRAALWREQQGEFWFWPHPTFVIWGATAGILQNLAQRLRV